MKDAKKAEIRRVLLGRAVLATDGRLIAIPAGTFMKSPVGIGDGAGSVLLFGMLRRIRRYETKDGRTRVSAAVTKAMQNIGRGLILNEQNEAAACLIRYLLTRPVVLVFTYEDGIPTLTAWTGRTNNHDFSTFAIMNLVAVAIKHPVICVAEFDAVAAVYRSFGKNG